MASGCILLAAGSEQAQRDLYNTIQGMNAMMNNNSIQILGENDSFETHQYTFGGIADTYDRFMMDVAGAAETPVTKLFGRSPAGMNATGESDMQNYYDTIEEKQESVLRPIYDKLLPIMAMSALGAVPDDLDFEFNAVRRPDEDEMSDLASKNTDSVTKAFQAGLISQRTALKELRSQSEITGMWTNITDEDIEKADDTIQDPNEGMEDMGSLFGGEGADAKGNEPKNGEKPGQDKPPMPKEKTAPGQNMEPQRTTDAARKNKETWRTINGAKVPIKNGVIVGGAGGRLNGIRVDEETETQESTPFSVGSKNYIWGHGKQKPKFYPKSATRQHDEHHEKHAKEMGLTHDQWIREAAGILNDKASGDYLDWMDPQKGRYYRFNKRNMRIVVGNTDGEINTYYDIKISKLKKYLPPKSVDRFLK
jgi:hypothetical protein